MFKSLLGKKMSNKAAWAALSGSWGGESIETDPAVKASEAHWGIMGG
jgi:hypothetical protein